MADLWEFPGGKIEAVRHLRHDCARITEELAIDTKSSCLAPLSFVSHEYDDFHLVMLLYVCRRWWGTPQPVVASELAWVRAPRLGDYAMPPADKPLISALQDLL